MDLIAGFGPEQLLQFAAGLVAGGVGMRLVLRIFSHQEPTRSTRSRGTLASGLARGATTGEKTVAQTAGYELARLLMAASSPAQKRK